MKDNVVKNKSFAFAVRIVTVYQLLGEQKKEFVLSKQLLISGASVGVMIREAEHAESKSDFKHKMGISQKEINETIYWQELLRETNYMNIEQFESINADAIEIIKLISTIIKSTKASIDN